MILNEIIEEEDEEKSIHKYNKNDNYNNTKKLNKNNIKVIKDEKDIKDNKDIKINKVNHSHKSVSAPKDNKDSRMHISNYLNNNLRINEKELNKVKALLDNRNENMHKINISYFLDFVELKEGLLIDFSPIKDGFN